MQQTPSAEERTPPAPTISTVPAPTISTHPTPVNTTRRQGHHYVFDPNFDLPQQYPPGHHRRARRSSYEAPPAADNDPNRIFNAPRTRLTTQEYYQEMQRQQYIREANARQRYAIMRPKVLVSHDTPLEVVCLHGCVCGRTSAANPLVTDNTSGQVMAHYQPLRLPEVHVQHPAFTRQDDSYEIPSQLDPYYETQQQTRR